MSNYLWEIEKQIERIKALESDCARLLSDNKMLLAQHERDNKIYLDVCAREKKLYDENARLRGAILWALGETEEFKVREAGDGAYWWRTELRKKSALEGEK